MEEAPAQTWWQRLLDLLSSPARGAFGEDLGWIVVGIGALAAIILVGLILRSLFGGRRQEKLDPQRGLHENLAEYPPPPASPGPRRLTVEGWPVRLRLVVVAPAGKSADFDAGAVEALLEQTVRGLGALVQHDKPRIRVWPAQLSKEGFAPTFHRLTHGPEAEGQSSRWILVAGPTPARPRRVLLGLALLADEPNTIGRLAVEPDRWDDVLRIKMLET